MKNPLGNEVLCCGGMRRFVATPRLKQINLDQGVGVDVQLRPAVVGLSNGA